MRFAPRDACVHPRSVTCAGIAVRAVPPGVLRPACARSAGYEALEHERRLARSTTRPSPPSSAPARDVAPSGGRTVWIWHRSPGGCAPQLEHVAAQTARSRVRTLPRSRQERCRSASNRVRGADLRRRSPARSPGRLPRPSRGRSPRRGRHGAARARRGRRRTTELPSARRSSMTPSNPSTLEGCRPIDGSSSTYEDAGRAVAHGTGELHALALAGGKRRARAVEREVAQAQLLQAALWARRISSTIEAWAMGCTARRAP